MTWLLYCAGAATASQFLPFTISSPPRNAPQIRLRDLGQRCSFLHRRENDICHLQPPHVPRAPNTQKAFATEPWRKRFFMYFGAHETCLVAANVLISDKRNVKITANVVVFETESINQSINRGFINAKPLMP